MLKDYVKNMKTSYHIDEFNISNFCINTVKAFNQQQNKFILFNNLLHSFHDIEEIYEDTFTSYSAFISYSVIKASLIKDKNILSYESYVYNVLDGFYFQKYNKKIDPKDLAKVWTNIVFIFNKIIELSANPNYNSITNFLDIYSTFKHINTTNKQPSGSYSYSIPLLFEKENNYDVFIIVPKLKNNYYNILIPYLINYFKNKLDNIFILELDLNTLNYSFNTITITNTLLNSYRKYLDTLYIDFNKINYQNCSYCSLTCNKTELLNTRYIVSPFNAKNRKIGLINI